MLRFDYVLLSVIRRLRSSSLCFCLLFVSFSTSASFAERIRLLDDLGREIELIKPPKRIISLAPHITENLFAIGAGETIVGTVEYSDFPEQARNIPRVGNYESISIEAIIDLKPDLIIAWHAGIKRPLLQRFEQLNIPVYVDELNSTQDIARSLRVYGSLLGLDDQAKIVADTFIDKIAEFAQRYRDMAKVSVFYQVWHSPIQTLNNESLIGELIQLCGGRNIFGDAKAVAPVVSVESVIAENPQLIVTGLSDNEQADSLGRWTRFQHIDAVKHNRLVVIHPDIIQRHTTRVALGIEEMCGAIHTTRAILEP